MALAAALFGTDLLAAPAVDSGGGEQRIIRMRHRGLRVLWLTVLSELLNQLAQIRS